MHSYLQISSPITTNQTQFGFLSCWLPDFPDITIPDWFLLDILTTTNKPQLGHSSTILTRTSHLSVMVFCLEFSFLKEF